VTLLPYRRLSGNSLRQILQSQGAPVRKAEQWCSIDWIFHRCFRPKVINGKPVTKFDAWEQTDYDASRRITWESSGIANQSIDFEQAIFSEMHIQCRKIKAEMNWSRLADIMSLAIPGRQPALRTPFSCFRIWWDCWDFAQISTLGIEESSILGLSADLLDQSPIINAFLFGKSSSRKPHYHVSNTLDFCDLSFLLSSFPIHF
jgi:hypothetical protein